MTARISSHFKTSEMTRTGTGLPNNPGYHALYNLTELCHDVLEPVRALLKCPLVITSGYRSEEVNRAVGGKATSQHLEGRAADFIPSGCRLLDAYLLIRDSQIPYDQLILENGWIHISHAKNPRRKAFVL